MCEEDQKRRYIQVAVIGRRGIVEHRMLPVQETEPPPQPGKLYFPFPKTAVFSSVWRASEHTTLLPRDPE